MQDTSRGTDFWLFLQNAATKEQRDALLENVYGSFPDGTPHSVKAAGIRQLAADKWRVTISRVELPRKRKIRKNNKMTRKKLIHLKEAMRRLFGDPESCSSSDIPMHSIVVSIPLKKIENVFTGFENDTKHRSVSEARTTDVCEPLLIEPVLSSSPTTSASTSPSVIVLEDTVDHSISWKETDVCEPPVVEPMLSSSPTAPSSTLPAVNVQENVGIVESISIEEEKEYEENTECPIEPKELLECFHKLAAKQNIPLIYDLDSDDEAGECVNSDSSLKKTSESICESPTLPLYSTVNSFNDEGCSDVIGNAPALNDKMKSAVNVVKSDNYKNRSVGSVVSHMPYGLVSNDYRENTENRDNDNIQKSDKDTYSSDNNSEISNPESRSENNDIRNCNSDTDRTNILDPQRARLKVKSPFELGLTSLPEGVPSSGVSMLSQHNPSADKPCVTKLPSGVASQQKLCNPPFEQNSILSFSDAFVLSSSGNISGQEKNDMLRQQSLNMVQHYVALCKTLKLAKVRLHSLAIQHAFLLSQAMEGTKGQRKIGARKLLRTLLKDATSVSISISDFSDSRYVEVFYFFLCSAYIMLNKDMEHQYLNLSSVPYLMLESSVSDIFKKYNFSMRNLVEPQIKYYIDRLPYISEALSMVNSEHITQVPSEEMSSKLPPSSPLTPPYIPVSCIPNQIVPSQDQWYNTEMYTIGDGMNVNQNLLGNIPYGVPCTQTAYPGFNVPKQATPQFERNVRTVSMPLTSRDSGYSTPSTPLEHELLSPSCPDLDVFSENQKGVSNFAHPDTNYCDDVANLANNFCYCNMCRGGGVASTTPTGSMFPASHSVGHKPVSSAFFGTDQQSFCPSPVQFNGNYV